MDQKQIDKYLDKMVEKAEKEIDLVFANRLKEIKAQLARMLERGVKDSRSNAYRTKRFQAEMEYMKQNVNEDYKKLYKDTQKLLQTQYIDNLLRSGFLYEFEAQESMGYVVPQLSTVNQAILNPIKELTLSVLMTGQRNEIIKNIRIEIAQGLIAGEDYTTISERLERSVNFSKVKAKRVARTEAGRVQTQSRLDSGEIASKRANLTKVWNSALDTLVRKAHRVLDDKEADKDGYFMYQGHRAKGPHLFGVARLDINCRCTLLFLVNGKRPALRRGRNYEDPTYQRKLAKRIDEYMQKGLTAVAAEKKAKKEIFPPGQQIEYQSFEEWYSKLPKGA